MGYKGKAIKGKMGFFGRVKKDVRTGIGKIKETYGKAQAAYIKYESDKANRLERNIERQKVANKRELSRLNSEIQLEQARAKLARKKMNLRKMKGGMDNGFFGAHDSFGTKNKVGSKRGITQRDYF